MRSLHPRPQIAALLWAILLIVLMGATPPLAAPDRQSPVQQVTQRHHTDDLSAIKQRRTLRALVNYSRSDFFFTGSGTPKGLQVDLLEEYEKFLNKGIKRETERTRIQFIPTTFDRLIPDLLAGKGDIAAAILTITPERSEEIDFISSKQQNIRELIVTHKSVDRIRSLEDLAGRELYVLKNSSYAEHLRALNRLFLKKGLPPIGIVEADAHLTSEDILELVNSGVVKITLVDDYKANVWARILPDIRVLDSPAVAEAASAGWGVRQDNPELQKSLKAFLKKVKRGTLLGNMLFNRYYRNTRWIKNPVSDKKRKRLQTLIKYFKKYSSRYEFDYLAMVAQGYQESSLDQSKRSHRGAVGIMQLLPSTAADKNVAIPDIGSVENNIHAGTKYLAFIRDRYFVDPEIRSEDRMAFSWAAYNAGPASVQKMRALAKKMGLDSNVWHANVEFAANKLIGRETVRYVSNIFKYYIAYRLVRDQMNATLPDDKE